MCTSNILQNRMKYEITMTLLRIADNDSSMLDRFFPIGTSKGLFQLSLSLKTLTIAIPRYQNILFQSCLEQILTLFWQYWIHNNWMIVKTHLYLNLVTNSNTNYHSAYLGPYCRRHQPCRDRGWCNDGYTPTEYKQYYQMKKLTWRYASGEK